MELLAPAGSMEALRAAVCNGADAVYLGADTFNARMNARNFSAADLQEAVVYCHVRGVKVHLTLNTLVLDREMPRAAELIRMAAILRRRCVHRAGSGHGIAVPAACTGCAHPRLHADEHPFARGRIGGRRAGMQPRCACAGIARRGDRAYLQEKPGRDRGFRPRRFVHVLLRAVLSVLRHRPPLRQPGPVRAALPPTLRLRPV